MTGPFDFGIGIYGNGNLVEENSAGRNTPSGIVIFGVGNTVQPNQAVGNVDIETSLTSGLRGVDINNFAGSGTNTFEDNLCETSRNAPCPNFPDFAGHKPPKPGS